MRHVTEYAPANTREYLSDIPQYPKLCVLRKKYLKDDTHKSLHLAQKICSDDCPWTLSVPQSSLTGGFSPRNR